MPDDHFTNHLQEYGRSLIGKDIPDDPTVAKVIALAAKTTKVLSRNEENEKIMEGVKNIGRGERI